MRDLLKGAGTVSAVCAMLIYCGLNKNEKK